MIVEECISNIISIKKTKAIEEILFFVGEIDDFKEILFFVFLRNESILNKIYFAQGVLMFLRSGTLNLCCKLQQRFVVGRRYHQKSM